MDQNAPSRADEAWVAIGPHRYAQHPQHSEWQPHGLVELSHAEEFVRRLLAHQAKVGHLALIVDGRDLAPLSPEVRSFYVQSLAHVIDRIHVVVFGASFLTKVTQTLAVRAGQIVNNIKVDLRFVETREAAVAYIQNR